MPETNLPLISLCMIVRDSQDSLVAALESAQPFVDEIVVVDTGSEDATIEVAKQHDAAVFEFPWCDDFSAARNHSIEKATGDWIFWMDSDDVLLPGTGEEMRRLAETHPDRDTVFLAACEERMNTANASGQVESTTHVRLFPRHPELRFEYRVHEQLIPAVTRLGLKVRTTSMRVEHVTTRSDDAGERRYERNMRLLRLDLEERPDDPWVLLNIGRLAHFRLENSEEAIGYLRRAVSLMDADRTADRGFLLNLQLELESVYRRNGNDDEAIRCLMEARKMFPQDAAVLWRLGNAFERKNELQNAITCYHELAQHGIASPIVFQIKDVRQKAAGKVRELSARLGINTTATPANIAQAFQSAVQKFRAGQMAEAFRDCQQIVARDPNHKQSLYLAGVIAGSTNNPQQAVQLLSRAIQVDPNVSDYHRNLALAFHQLARYEEALRHYDAALSLRPDDADAHFGRGNTLVAMDQIDPAIHHFREVIRLQPNQLEANAILGKLLESKKER